MKAGFTHHGGRLADARARFGGEPSSWLDLSTGINPNAWCPSPDLQVDWHRLPDPASLRSLEAAAADHFACNPELCIAVPGIEAALRLIARLLDLPGLYCPPCYGTYRTAFAQSEPWARHEALPEHATVLVQGNPNNPDGLLAGPEALLATLRHQQRCGGWLIVDEAFADCDPSASLAAMVSAGRRLVVLRSFGKFFGLAGVRLGFVIAPPEIAAGLRPLLGDWPLHAAAIALGTAAYQDRRWIEQAREALACSATKLDALLARKGLRAGGSCPLFRLIHVPDAPALFERLAQRHILTRPFAEYPGMLRIGLPADQAACDWLEQALG